MTLEEAIKTALQFEYKVRDAYQEAQRQATDDVGKRIFHSLAQEEQAHCTYLQARLDEWTKNGKINPAKLETILPSSSKIAQGVSQLKKRVAERDYNIELEMLRKALRLEMDTSNFYQQMVDELTDEGQQMFAQFLEIEKAHYDLVQAQIDSLSGMGVWFDYQEFNLEGA